jgi:hypothetical protein
MNITNITTTTAHDPDDSDLDKIADSNKISLPELDSGLSETELPLKRRTVSTSSKLNAVLSLPTSLPASSDVESGFSGDYSPYDKTLSSPIDQRRRSSLDNNDIPTLERIALELNSIALDWRSYHAPVHCACSLPFDSAQRKVRQ